MRWRRLKRGVQEKPESPPLAFPYYVDEPGLRTLADSLGITIHLTRETGRERRVKIDARGIGAERQEHDVVRSGGHIHLNHLAADLKQSAAFRDIVDVLGLVPSISDQSILSAAIAHIEYMPADGEHDETLADQLRRAFDLERSRTIAAAKRSELKQVAAQNQLVIVRGRFEASGSATEEGSQMSVQLTHLEASEVLYESIEASTEVPMPEGVGIEAVLPSHDAFTPDGIERLSRGTPFYGRFIGHSASFEEASGLLTCCAYAVWGMSRPSVLLDKAQPYQFLEQS